MRTDRPAGDDASPPRPPGTRALLAALAAGDPDETIRFCDVFAGLGERAFGMLLFVTTLPAFIPIPGVGGAISGDRKSVVSGKSVAVRVDLGGRRSLNKKKTTNQKTTPNQARRP